MSKQDFAHRLMAWQAAHGRHDLPWQRTRDPYRVWLSEIMLQQTQVGTVIPYYLRFLERFPQLADLAAAPQEAVLGLWSGLGYYARARNLHKAAQTVMAEHGGQFPQQAEMIARLPGIGRSTAAAIAAFCFGERVPILDGNVKRVLCRAFGVEGFPGERAVEQRLWALAEDLLPATGVGRYIQAQMDLGATVCTRTRPACTRCPLAGDCMALRDGRTAELPAARPRKAPPRRSVEVAVVRAGDAVLLERRPAAGIWGGLLALPEADAAGAAAWAARRFGVADGRALPALTHTFTHFVLEIRPWLVDLPAPPALAADGALRWQALDALDEAPLPTPVRTILQGLRRP
ncbi:A/G-specific adenine glycosylase [Pseudothauera rhizosphaerae]|uniref:A/G-specific adenine glycosylase n=1 Tax=Pseudothauera rhizosphaerae TaxID=2565932 RepID=UPI0022AABA90|nr:A/G-specific adenine glycosylase [Pseudothauera rhizosphaerae]